MGDPNKPRLLTQPRPRASIEDDHVSGNAARDGFTQRAAARPKRPYVSDETDYCGPGEISPAIGKSTYGPYPYED